MSGLAASKFGYAHLQRTAYTLPATVLAGTNGTPIAPRLNLAATAPHHAHDHHEPLEGKKRTNYTLIPKWATRSEVTPLGITSRTSYIPVSTAYLGKRMASTAVRPTVGDHVQTESPLHPAPSEDTVYSPAVPDYSKYTKKQSEDSSRSLSYFMIGSMGLLTAVGARSAVSDFIANLTASADVLALAKVEVDLAAIPEGKNVIIKWRGKPVFVRHRTQADIDDANNVDLKTLRDPEKDSDRVQKPEWLVMVGVCTHLGCVPIGEAGDYNGWFCPCHGSHYDSSGRARKGPAPLNLEIPAYSFGEDNKLIIG